MGHRHEERDAAAAGIAAKPKPIYAANSMVDLKKKLGSSLNKISSCMWKGAYRKVQRKEGEYMVKVHEDRAKRRAIADAEAEAVYDAAEEQQGREYYVFHC
ncbi:hypothetical protein PC119_g15867 [Phytophthora cactorum]|nr:hypothetical protein PC112_g14941 [Phytophthora cactorum]KAG2813773.1 hypothetical protein PC111_g14253 [Phytophthora cactorum]KAG3003711.1 hypothetical protein PC119_g15867 [Phytophthora cactorum]